MIYTAPYELLLMRANPLRGQVGGGWALEVDTLLGPVKWHRAVRRACCLEPENLRLLGPDPLPLAQVMDFPASKHNVQGNINQRSIGSFMYMSFKGPVQ
jgi:hypothetical protein